MSDKDTEQQNPQPSPIPTTPSDEPTPQVGGRGKQREL